MVQKTANPSKFIQSLVKFQIIIAIYFFNEANNDPNLSEPNPDLRTVNQTEPNLEMAKVYIPGT